MYRLALLALLTATLLAGPGPAQTFPDKNLAVAVQAALRLPKAEFKDDDLAKLSVLDVTGKKVKSLAGLDKCKGLLELKANKNEISDLKPLKDLTALQSLYLSENKIDDLAPLAGLTKLQYLELQK